MLQNQIAAHEVLIDYVWWTKSIEISGLSRCSHIPVNLLRNIRCSEFYNFKQSDIVKLITGLRNVKKESCDKLDALIAKLENLECIKKSKESLEST